MEIYIIGVFRAQYWEYKFLACFMYIDFPNRDTPWIG